MIRLLKFLIIASNDQRKIRTFDCSNERLRKISKFQNHRLIWNGVFVQNVKTCINKIELRFMCEFYPFYSYSDQFSEEPMRLSSKDDSRRIRKQLPLPQQQPSSSKSQPLLCYQLVPPLPNQYSNTLARQSVINESSEVTYAHYTFPDEKVPYRVKLPTKKVTLKLFKENAPKKGNFR